MPKKKRVSRSPNLRNRRARNLLLEQLERRILLAVDLGGHTNQALAFHSEPILSSDNVLVSILGDGHDHEELFGEPTNSLTEGHSIRLDAVFDDIDTESERTVEIDWGDNSPIVVQTIPAGRLGFSADHTYLDDLANTDNDTYTISIVATDAGGNQQQASAELDVINVAPHFETTAVSDVDLIEGDSLTFTATFADPGNDDHTVEVDWGDGVSQTITVAAGSRDIQLSHTYLDDASASDKAVVVTLLDDDGGETAHNFIVSVANASPTAEIVADDVGTEGMGLALVAQVTDPGADTFSYYWEIFQANRLVVTSSVSAFDFVPTNEGSYVVELTVTDDDDASVVAESWSVEIGNAAPVIDDEAFRVYDGQGVEVTTIDEGDTLHLDTLFADLGLFDRHVVTVDWGDGSTDEFELPAGVRELTGLSHTFLDNAASQDIIVTVRDEADDDTISTSVVVENVAPVAMIRDDGSDTGRVRLKSDVFDPGVLDAFTYSWKVLTEGIADGGQVAMTGDTIEFAAPADGFVELEITVSDDDGGDDTVSTLFVGATASASDIDVSPTVDTNDDPRAVSVRVTTDTSNNSGDFVPGDYIILVGSEADDEIDINSDVTTPTAISGGDGDDTIRAGSGNDTIMGGLGADHIETFAGNDVLISDAGDDHLLGGLGDDHYIVRSFSDKTIIDTGGRETLDFSDAPISTGPVSGVTIDLSLDDGSTQLVHSDGTVSITGSVENVVGTQFNDVIKGSTSDNRLFGGDGDDTIDGGGLEDLGDGDSGNDSIFGGDGDDSIQGGTGAELLDGGEGDDFLVAGDDGGDSVTGGGGNDFVKGGSGGGDSLFGGDGDDTIEGGDGGEDSIGGGDGNDSIFGGDGSNDTIDGGSGDDSIVGGNSGQDSIFGGDGDDSIEGGDGGEDSINGGSGNDSIFGGDGSDDTIDGGSGNDSIVGGNSGNDSIFGGDGDDTIEGGDGGEDSINGGSGNDSIFGGDGSDDTIDGGSGDDSIIGGQGQDSIFGGDGDDTIVGPDNGTDTIGGGDGNDSIFGGDGSNDTIDGGAGDDVIIGGINGQDSIFGGDGDDTIEGGGGEDTIGGGNGNDSIFGGDGGNDTIDGGGGEDSIKGGGGHDSIFGGDGDDTIEGGGGEDSIGGGDGQDSIFGGDGDDSVEGGGGEDSIGGGDGQDSIFGGDGDDSIEGGGGEDSIGGGDGNDSIFGGDGGDDTIDGGGGDDSIVGGDGGHDSIFGGDGDDTIEGGDGGEDTIGGGEGNDSIFGGDGGDDTIDGGGGDDTIVGGHGVHDSIFGGDGDDSIEGGDGGEDTIGGGEGNDSIFGGDGGDDSIDGGGGDDSIIGGHGGNDSIFGGDGDDTIEGGDGGEDSIGGGDGNDSIFGGDGTDDTIDGGSGNDSIVGGNSGQDSIFGGDGDDSIEGGDGGEDTIGGGNGNDSIFGGDGDDDSISGGDGDDSIGGGSGQDSIFGGNGNDSLVASGATDYIAGGPNVAGNDVAEIDWVIFQGNTDIDLSNSQLAAGHTSYELTSIERAELTGGESANNIDTRRFTGGVKVFGLGDADEIRTGDGDDTLNGGAGNDRLEAGAGDDRYVFGSDAGGADRVTEKQNEDGSDTIDFVELANAAEFDLSESTWQTVNQDLEVRLSDGSAIENVWGTAYSDNIRGNELDNLIIGFGGIDILNGAQGNDTVHGGYTRIVHLDFDSYTSDDDHVYTADERTEISARIAADFAKFDVQIVTEPPSGLPYFDVQFNQPPVINGVPQSGGAAEGIDWRGLFLDGTVVVDINGFFGDGENELTGSSENIIGLSATIAAHEMGHMLGMRHHDAMSAPGLGLYEGVAGTRFLPEFTGPSDASMTPLHLISSPASVGTSLIDAMGNPHFGEREAIKLAYAESGVPIMEATIHAKDTSITIGDTTYSAQSLGHLDDLAVPNTLADAAEPNHGKSLAVGADNVIGKIELTDAGTSESDFYSFTANAGEVIAVEVMSYTLRHRVANVLDTLVRVYDAKGDILDYHGADLGAFNDDGMEPTDSVLLDLAIPNDGTYFVEVDSFSFYQPEFSTYVPGFDVDAYCSANPHHVGCTDKDTGEYELLIYSFGVDEDNKTLGDTIIGGSGEDRLVGNSGNDTFYTDSGDTIVDPSGHATIIENQPPELVAINNQNVVEGTQLTLTATAFDERDGLRFRLANGQRARIHQGASLDSESGEFSWTPTDDGIYTFRLVVTDSAGNEDLDEIEVVVSNTPPRITSVKSTASEPGSTEPGDVVEIRASVEDDGEDTHTATIYWGDGNSADVSVNDDGTINASHSYSESGAYRVRLVVTDDDDAVAQRYLFSAITGVKLTGNELSVVGTGNGDQVSLTANDDQLIAAASFLDEQVSFALADVTRSKIWLGDGNNRLSIAHNVNTNDTIYTHDGNDVITTGSGAWDVVVSGAGNDIVVGGSGRDVAVTGPGDDIFAGLGGDDIYFAGAGNDTFYGGDGNDMARGGHGDDKLFGQAGNDVLDGGAGNDVVVGHDGNDRLFGNDGLDLVIGGTGIDVVNGGGGEDIVIAGTTSFDLNRTALALIMEEWTSDRTYDVRIANLRNGSGSDVRSNDDIFLVKDDTVLDDDSADVVTGGSELDWFFALLDEEDDASDTLDIQDNEQSN